MTSLYKTLLTFSFLTLFQLLPTLASTSATSTASVYCTDKCGNMSISYPFGIHRGCFREGFQIICNDETGTASTIDGVPIIDILLSQAQIRVYNLVGYSCSSSDVSLSRAQTSPYKKTGLSYSHPKGGRNNISYESYLGLSDVRYKISNTRNKFTAVGCQTLATISDPYTQSSHYTNNSDIFGTGCISLCTNQSRIVDNSPCSGIGCCQATLPEGLSYYEIKFSPGYLNKAIWDYSPCTYAFVAEEGFYSFFRSDIEQDNLFRRFEQVPVVLDWVIGIETCKEARLNKSGHYACVSLKSTCKDSQNGPGYTCICSLGYQGNPYITGGCTDIDECKNITLSQCHGNCTNLQGSYSCSCPVGSEGNPKILVGCRRIQQLNISIIVIILVGPQVDPSSSGA